jgi:hypothetical protein
MKKYMKDIIHQSNHRYYSKELLNRTIEKEQKRVRRFKEFVEFGMSPYKAYMKSKVKL